MNMLNIDTTDTLLVHTRRFDGSDSDMLAISFLCFSCCYIGFWCARDYPVREKLQKCHSCYFHVCVCVRPVYSSDSAVKFPILSCFLRFYSGLVECLKFHRKYQIFLLFLVFISFWGSLVSSERLVDVIFGGNKTV